MQGWWIFEPTGVSIPSWVFWVLEQDMGLTHEQPMDEFQSLPGFSGSWNTLRADRQPTRTLFQSLPGFSGSWNEPPTADEVFEEMGFNPFLGFLGPGTRQASGSGQVELFQSLPGFSGSWNHNRGGRSHPRNAVVSIPSWVFWVLEPNRPTSGRRRAKWCFNPFLGFLGPGTGGENTAIWHISVAPPLR